MRRLLHGYIETFFVLGDQEGIGFVNHTGKVLITDPAKAMRFENIEDAMNYYDQNKNNFSEKLRTHEIRITVELI